MMGFSFQKAKFESAHLDPEARAKWDDETWPQRLKDAKKINAHIMFGDEAPCRYCQISESTYGDVQPKRSLIDISENGKTTEYNLH